MPHFPFLSFLFLLAPSDLENLPTMETWKDMKPRDNIFFSFSKKSWAYLGQTAHCCKH